MFSQTLKQLRDADPFLPFWVKMKDGSRHPVNQSNEFIIPSDHVAMLNWGRFQVKLDQVESVEVDERSRRKQMTLQAIQQMYRAEPFVPFVIHLTDGRSIEVKSPEFFAAAPAGRIVTVYQPDGSFNLIDLLLVSDLEVTPEPILKEPS